MFQRIIVPLDGSAVAERAIEQAATMARLTGATLLLVRVVDISRLDHFGAPALSLDAKLLARLESQERETAQTYLDELREQLAAKNVPATTEVRQGLVGHELIGLAGQHDLVVMATRGRGSAAQSLLSSTTEIMARHSRSSVMLVQTGHSLADAVLMHGHDPVIFTS